MSGTILWLEDEPSLRKSVEPLLKERGFEIFPVISLEDAIAIYRSHHDNLAMIIADTAHCGARERDLAGENFREKMIPFLLFTNRSDAEAAVDLLDSGVRDFLAKPVSREKFMSFVSNALQRAPHPAYGEGREGQQAGMDFLVIQSRTREIDHALEWIRKKTEAKFHNAEMDKFLCFVNEHLLNAHEHGNLHISEKEKMDFLENDTFSEEVRRREKSANAHIEIGLALNGAKVRINITDEGMGFDFGKYLNADRDVMKEKIFSPCGRGIMITCQYFDFIEYSEGGRRVTLTKSFG